MRPAKPASAKEVEALVEQLADDDFDRRQRTARLLEEMGGRAESWLRKAMQDKTDLERKRRVTRLLARLPGWVAARGRASPRALELLERLATPAAVRCLRETAKGSDKAAVLQRLGR